MVWNAISFQHDEASTAGQIDLKTFIGQVFVKIFKSSSSTLCNRASISSSLAGYLMRCLSRVLEDVIAGRTFELSLIKLVDHIPVRYATRDERFTAVWTRLIYFHPIVNAFFAIQL